jgi:hypothetical protein
MKTTLRERFDVDESTFWRDLFFDQSFLDALYRKALGCIDVSFLEDSGDAPAGRTRRLRFTQKLGAPAAVRKLFGETTTMEEQGRFDPQSKRWRFTMQPDRMAEKVRISGETWVTSLPDGGIERNDELEFAVSIFGVGALVERFMASATAETFAKQAEFTRSYLKERATR